MSSCSENEEPTLREEIIGVLTDYPFISINKLADIINVNKRAVYKWAEGIPKMEQIDEPSDQLLDQFIQLPTKDGQGTELKLKDLLREPAAIQNQLKELKTEYMALFVKYPFLNIKKLSKLTHINDRTLYEWKKLALADFEQPLEAPEEIPDISIEFSARDGSKMTMNLNELIPDRVQLNPLLDDYTKLFADYPLLSAKKLQKVTGLSEHFLVKCKRQAADDGHDSSKLDTSVVSVENDSLNLSLRDGSMIEASLQDLVTGPAAIQNELNVLKTEYTILFTLYPFLNIRKLATLTGINVQKLYDWRKTALLDSDQILEAPREPVPDIAMQFIARSGKKLMINLKDLVPPNGQPSALTQQYTKLFTDYPSLSASKIMKLTGVGEHFLGRCKKRAFAESQNNSVTDLNSSINVDSQIVQLPRGDGSVVEADIQDLGSTFRQPSDRSSALIDFYSKFFAEHPYLSNKKIAEFTGLTEVYLYKCKRKTFDNSYSTLELPSDCGDTVVQLPTRHDTVVEVKLKDLTREKIRSDSTVEAERRLSLIQIMLDYRQVSMNRLSAISGIAQSTLSVWLNKADELGVKRSHKLPKTPSTIKVPLKSGGVTEVDILELVTRRKGRIPKMPIQPESDSSSEDEPQPKARASPPAQLATARKRRSAALRNNLVQAQSSPVSDSYEIVELDASPKKMSRKRKSVPLRTPQISPTAVCSPVADGPATIEKVPEASTTTAIESAPKVSPTSMSYENFLGSIGLNMQLAGKATSTAKNQKSKSEPRAKKARKVTGGMTGGKGKNDLSHFQSRIQNLIKNEYEEEDENSPAEPDSVKISSPIVSSEDPAAAAKDKEAGTKMVTRQRPAPRQAGPRPRLLTDN